jgi:DNA-binding transcriptional regulator YhcF (GntR family)
MLKSMNRENSDPLYLQIRNQIRDLIFSGDLSA